MSGFDDMMRKRASEAAEDQEFKRIREAATDRLAHDIMDFQQQYIELLFKRIRQLESLVQSSKIRRQDSEN